MWRQLEENISKREKTKGQKHKVLRDSFDAKEILNRQMLITKLDYIHSNPCNGKWMLSEDFTCFTKIVLKSTEKADKVPQWGGKLLISNF